MKFFNLNSRIGLVYSLVFIGIFLNLGVKYFLSDNLQIYDGPGHLNLIWNIRENLWPAFWGWNVSSLLGFDQGIYYPPLFHYSAAALSFLFGIENSVKLIVFSAFVLLPISTYFLLGKIFTDAKSKLFSSSFVLLLLLIAPGYLGGGIKALTEVGLLTSFVATPLILLYLGTLFNSKKTNWLVQTLLLSAIILTHFVAGVFCLLTLSTFLIVKILTKNFSKRDLFHPITTVFLTCFFWLPLVLRFEYTSVSVHLPSLSWPNIAVLLLSLLLAFGFWKKKKINLLTLSIVAVCIALVCSVDSLFSEVFPNSFIAQKLYSLHIYRYQIYGYITFLIALLYWPVNFLFSLKKPKVNPFIVVSLPLLVLLILIVVKPALFINKAEISIEQKVIGKGRFLETFSREESYPFIYTSQVSLIEDKNQSWAYGLFTDANLNGPYLGSLIKTLTLTKANLTNNFTIEDKKLDIRRLNDILDMFAVGNLLYLGSESGKSNEENFFVLKNSNRNFASYPRQEIQFVSENWDKEVFDWWFEKGRLTTLLVKGEKIKIASVNTVSNNKEEPKIIQKNKSWSDFVIQSNSKESRLILVKFSYSPNWKAYNEQNQEIKIYRASPNLMLAFARGKTHFVYELLWYQKLAFAVSLLTVTGVVWCIYKRHDFKI